MPVSTLGEKNGLNAVLRHLPNCVRDPLDVVRDRSAELHLGGGNSETRRWHRIVRVVRVFLTLFFRVQRPVETSRPILARRYEFLGAASYLDLGGLHLEVVKNDRCQNHSWNAHQPLADDQAKQGEPDRILDPVTDDLLLRKYCLCSTTKKPTRRWPKSVNGESIPTMTELLMMLPTIGRRPQRRAQHLPA